MTLLRSFSKQLAAAGAIAVAASAASYASAGTVLIDGYGDVPTIEAPGMAMYALSPGQTDLIGPVSVTATVAGSTGSSINPDGDGAALSVGFSGPATFTFEYDLTTPFDFSAFSSVQFGLVSLDNPDITASLNLDGFVIAGVVGPNSITFDLTGAPSDVDEIITTITAQAGDDFKIDSYAVPSPTAAGLGALGLMAFGIRRRR